MYPTSNLNRSQHSGLLDASDQISSSALHETEQLHCTALGDL